MSLIDGELAPDWIEKNHPENGTFRAYWTGVDENDPEWGYSGGITFDPDEGQGLRYEWHYKDGKRDGVSRAWWPNGVLKSEWYWDMGLKTGEWKRWHQNGKLNVVKYFDNGQKIGTHTKWWNTGQINEERVFDYPKYNSNAYIIKNKYDSSTGEKKTTEGPLYSLPELNKSQYRVKIYGAGSIGNHLSYACRNKGLDVTVCDIDESALSRMKNDIYPSRYGKWDNEIVLTHNEQVIDEYYDVVVIGTPPESHISIALEELESKNPPKILLIEKPLGTSDLKGCQELWDMSNKKDVLVLCGYNHTLTENTIISEKLINKGILGECKSLHVQWTEHWGGIFNAHPWIDGPKDCYLGFTDKGGGAMSEHSHAISLWQRFSYLLGYGKITEVYATMKKTDDYDEKTVMTVKTSEGLEGTITQDVVTNPPIKRVRIQGIDSYIKWDTNETEDSVEYLENSESHRQTTPTRTLIHTHSHAIKQLFKKSRPDDFVGEINHILQFLNDGVNKNSPIFLEKGLEVMLVIKAAILSDSTGKKVFIDYNAGYSLDSLKVDEG